MQEFTAHYTNYNGIKNQHDWSKVNWSSMYDTALSYLELKLIPTLYDK